MVPGGVEPQPGVILVTLIVVFAVADFYVWFSGVGGDDVMW
jgi:hypothetical protein